MLPVETSPVGDRDLLSIAVENAVEGCTLETYGAIVAPFQAERASLASRPLLKKIARDETRHAELAHDVAVWLDGKLTMPERAAVAKARAEALESLRARLDVEPPTELAAELGVPNARRGSPHVRGARSVICRELKGGAGTAIEGLARRPPEDGRIERRC